MRPPALLCFLVAAMACTGGPPDEAMPRRTPTPGPVERVAPDLSAFPSRNPFGTEWSLDPLYPDLGLGEVVWAGRTDARDERLYVLEHEGRVWEIRGHGADATRRLVLDVTPRVFHAHEAGAEGLAFHPDFARSGAPGENAVFLFYVARGDEALVDRLVRLEWEGDAIDPRSEEILIEQRHRWQADGAWGEHFGGTIAFGPDGFLYVGIGDEGGRYHGENPQRIDRNLFSGILRLDVDQIPARSHPPPRQPSHGRTSGYGIPRDNPFVGTVGALEEFWAIGLRNPWGFSFDANGALWVADVGWLDAEEIGIASAGSNHQWSYREGDLPGPEARPPSIPGSERAPLYSYPHGTGDTSIIGGAVYHGRAAPGLRGRYVFGDHGSGRIRSLLRTDDGVLPIVEEVAAVPPNHLLAFASMPDGEVLVLGRPPVGVSRITRATRSERDQPPRRLSGTGVFRDLPTRAPADGVTPYQINAPSFHHGPAADRWIALPGDGSATGHAVSRDRIVYRRDAPWSFPAGTVLILHEGHRSPPETRMLVLAAEGEPYGLTYRWNAADTDAERVDAPAERCATCHHAGAGYVLGVNARQLARADEESPLERWARAGVFTRRNARLLDVRAEDLVVTPLADLTADDATIAARARSYLDVNCAPCHRGQAASFSAEIGIPTSDLVGRPVRNGFGLPRARLIAPGSPERSLLWHRLASTAPGIAMPPGRSAPDPAGVTIVEEWIRAMPTAAPRSPEGSHGAPRADPR